MKTKLILWGKTEQDQKVLVAIELLQDENKVKTFIFNEDVATENFYNLLLNEWRFDKEVEFPTIMQTYESNLTASEEILPPGIMVEKPDLINRAKTEWHFIVLSKKLYDLYKDELENIKDQISNLTEYNSEKWNDLKTFWEKVQNHVKERNLFKNHVESLKNRTDELFNDLKELRNRADSEVKEKSEIVYSKFNELLDEVDKKIEKGLGLQPLFKELKDIQSDFREAEFTKEHRRKLWNRIDKTFKVIKEKKFGTVSKEKGPQQRTERRLEGLMAAINKMQESIDRDKSELDEQKVRIEGSGGQLESELRKARLIMIQERIDSKQEKLDDMYKTKVMLESKIDQEHKREEDREKYEKAKREAEDSIKEKVKESTELLKENEDKILKATEQIKTQEPKKGGKLNDIIEKSEDVLAVIADKVSDIAEDLLDKVEEGIEKVKDKIEDFTEKKDDKEEE